VADKTFAALFSAFNTAAQPQRGAENKSEKQQDNHPKNRFSWLNATAFIRQKINKRLHLGV